MSMAESSANSAHPANTEAQALQTLRNCLLDPSHDARRVLALADAIVALQRASFPR